MVHLARLARSTPTESVSALLVWCTCLAWERAVPLGAGKQPGAGPPVLGRLYSGPCSAWRSKSSGPDPPCGSGWVCCLPAGPMGHPHVLRPLSTHRRPPPGLGQSPPERGARRRVGQASHFLSFPQTPPLPFCRSWPRLPLGGRPGGPSCTLCRPRWAALRPGLSLRPHGPSSSALSPVCGVGEPINMPVPSCPT